MIKTMEIKLHTQKKKKILNSIVKFFKIFFSANFPLAYWEL